MKVDNKSWNEYRRLVLSELKNLNDKSDNINSTLSEIKKQIYANKLKIEIIEYDKNKKEWLSKTSVVAGITAIMSALANIYITAKK